MFLFKYKIYKLHDFALNGFTRAVTNSVTFQIHSRADETYLQKKGLYGLISMVTPDFLGENRQHPQNFWSIQYKHRKVAAPGMTSFGSGQKSAGLGAKRPGAARQPSIKRCASSWRSCSARAAASGQRPRQILSHNESVCLEPLPKQICNCNCAWLVGSWSMIARAKQKHP